MRSIEVDKGCLNLASPHHKQHQHRTALGKATVPSKWDDAQKWLVNLSRGGGGIDKPRDSNADDRRLISAAAAAAANPISIEDDYHEDTKRIDSSVVCVRDMGTEMTPLASQEPSRSATPVRATPSATSTPARPTPTPAAAAAAATAKAVTEDDDHRVVVENEKSSPRDHQQDSKLNPLETRASAWEEAERAKYMARFKREEVKIEAWENHQKRKAEMEMKRMEAKAERLKSRAQEKYTNKLASTRRIAEEKRAKAEAILNEKAVKTCERSDYIRRTGHLPSSFSSIYNLLLHPWSCCC